MAARGRYVDGWQGTTWARATCSSMCFRRDAWSLSRQHRGWCPSALLRPPCKDRPRSWSLPPLASGKLESARKLSSKGPTCCHPRNRKQTIHKCQSSLRFRGQPPPQSVYHWRRQGRADRLAWPSPEPSQRPRRHHAPSVPGHDVAHPSGADDPQRPRELAAAGRLHSSDAPDPRPRLSHVQLHAAQGARTQTEKAVGIQEQTSDLRVENISVPTRDLRSAWPAPSRSSLTSPRSVPGLSRGAMRRTSESIDCHTVFWPWISSSRGVGG